LKLNELGEKGKSQVVAEAVGMWEARGFCELPKAVWEERERAFCFSSLSIPPSFPQLFTPGW
jgi:hypothetical protein